MNLRACIILWLLPLVAFGQSVKTVGEKNVDWKSYTSFSVADGELVTVLEQEIDEEKLQSQIRETIIKELESRGLKYVEEGGDLSVDFTGELIQTTNIENVGPLGQEPADEAAQMDQSRIWTNERKQGSLAIVISDSKTSKSLWRSTASIDFAVEELPVVFNGATGKSFRKFPRRK